MNEPDNIRDAVLGRKIGTLVCDCESGRVKILIHERRRNSSRSRNGDGKKCRLHGARICQRCGLGKASPALVENVDVQAYGSAMKLKQLALITTPEPRLLVVQPFDAGDRQRHREGAERIEDRHHPTVDGKIIRLPIPELSEERRKDLVKSLGKMAEEARVRVRANRRAAMDEAKKLKAAGGLTEDGMRDTESEVQKLTDRFRKIDRRSSRAQRSRDHESVSPVCSRERQIGKRKYATAAPDRAGTGTKDKSCRARNISLRHPLVCFEHPCSTLCAIWSRKSFSISAWMRSSSSGSIASLRHRCVAEIRDGFDKVARMIGPAAGD